MRARIQGAESVATVQRQLRRPRAIVALRCRTALQGGHFVLGNCLSFARSSGQRRPEFPLIALIRFAVRFLWLNQIENRFTRIHRVITPPHLV